MSFAIWFNSSRFDFMEIKFSSTALLMACMVTCVVNYQIMQVWHARYDQQFGRDFILSGLVALFLPMLTVVGLPVYCLLAFGFPIWFQVPMLLFWAGGILFGLWWLKRIMLRKIFKKPNSEELEAIESL